MRFHHLLLPVVIAGIVPCQSQAPPIQSQTSLCVTTSIGTCGQVCEPFQCVPNHTMASAGETLFFDIASAPGASYALFTGIPVPTCQYVCGVVGELGLWAPISVFHVGTVSGAVPAEVPPACEVGMDSTTLLIPSTLPPGTDIRFQVLGINNTYTNPEQIAFSRPTEVRVR